MHTCLSSHRLHLLLDTLAFLPFAECLCFSCQSLQFLLSELRFLLLELSLQFFYRFEMGVLLLLQLGLVIMALILNSMVSGLCSAMARLARLTRSAI